MKLALLLWLASVLPQPVADRACLATTVYLEARSESTRGQMAVAEVALRRQESRRWGSSMCDVVRARGQFALSKVDKNYIVEYDESWRTAWMIAGIAMDIWSLPPGWRMAVVPKADHFYAANSTTPNWAQGMPLATIGDHRFYRVD